MLAAFTTRRCRYAHILNPAMMAFALGSFETATLPTLAFFKAAKYSASTLYKGKTDAFGRYASGR